MLVANSQIAFTSRDGSRVAKTVKITRHRLLFTFEMGTFWELFAFLAKRTKKWLLEVINFTEEFWSGRPGSNRRRPAWEAGILPLNYARSGQGRVANEMYGIGGKLSTRAFVARS
jgi:hypothetical protein